MAGGDRTFFVLLAQRPGLVGAGVRRAGDASLADRTLWLWAEFPAVMNYFCSPSAPIAQRLEQGTHNPLVAGSNPAGRTKPSSVMVGVFS